MEIVIIDLSFCVHKYSSKIDFIFNSISANDHLNIFHQIRPSLVCPPLYPFILHKTPENLNKIQPWGILGKIEYLQVLASPFRYLGPKGTTHVQRGIIHGHHCLSCKVTAEFIKTGNDKVAVNNPFCSIGNQFSLQAQEPRNTQSLSATGFHLYSFSLLLLMVHKGLNPIQSHQSNISLSFSACC